MDRTALRGEQSVFHFGTASRAFLHQISSNLSARSSTEALTQTVLDSDSKDFECIKKVLRRIIVRDLGREKEKSSFRKILGLS